ncbi:MAG: bile acid:sodium symporter family protein [Flavobacteriales bacterium]
MLFSTYLLPAVLAFIMLGMGSTLTLDNFRYLFRFPKGLLTGLLGQMVFLPLVAIAIAWVAPVSSVLKVGLVLVAACPGGATSNLIVHLLRGNVAMSVSFSAINSFLTMFSISFWVNLALRLFVGGSASITLSVQETFTHIFLIVLLPCVLGMIIKKWQPVFAHKAEKPMNIIMPVLLAIAMIGAIFIDKKDGVQVDGSLLAQIFPWVFLLNIAGLAGAFYIARFFRLGIRNSTTISIEVGMQNTGLAIYIATAPAMLHSAEAAMPAAVYALFTFFTAVTWGIFLRRKYVLGAFRRWRAR